MKKHLLVSGVFIIFSFLCITLNAQVMPDSNGIVYVNGQVAGGGNTGNSWLNAASSLGNALEAANTNTNIKQIWVAQGVYTPNYPADKSSIDLRDRAFVLPANVEVYGGFLGTEADISQRDWENNVTTLSGIAGNSGTAADKTYHVVVSAGNVGTALLDGFTVTGGYADGGYGGITVNGESIVRRDGGGIYMKNSSPVIRNIIVAGNVADNDGGGILCVMNANPRLENIVIHSNEAYFGGGMINHLQSSPYIINAKIYNNTAEEGAGIRNNDYSSPQIINSLIYRNNATGNGGGIQNLASSSPVLTNVTIANNTSSALGGGIYNDAGSATKVRNTIIWGNTSDNVSDTGGDIQYENTLLQGAALGDGINQNQNPLFVNESAGDYHLQTASPAIDKGDNSVYTEPALLGVTTDLDGQYRFNNISVDLGPYETQLIIPGQNDILYVNKAVVGGRNTGESWEDALRSLADALQVAGTNSKIKQIWVAKSVYTPAYMAGDGIQGRDKAFVLVAGVKVYGGFVGNETTVAQRDWKNNTTTLSGIIGLSRSISDYAYHVVISAGDMTGAVLDGFTVSGGNTTGGVGSITVNGETIVRRDGGGFYIQNSSPQLENIIITDNIAENDGGGMLCINNSSPHITNIAVHGNIAGNGGGLMTHTYSSPIIINAEIYNNLAINGAGIRNHNSSSPKIINALFYNNKANADGGAMMNIYSSAPELTNVTFTKNEASLTGGAIYNDAGCPAKVRNAIIWDNNAGNVYDPSNDIIYESTLLQNGTIGTGIILNQDPLFADPSNNNYRLTASSPAIDMGDDNFFTEPELSGILTDLDGQSRFNDVAVDLGPYEYLYVAPTKDILYVNRHVVGGTNTGESWQNALRSLADALKIAESNANIGQIWVAAGTYKPAYKVGNGTLDIDKAFVLVPGVKIYGGFAGYESNLTDRNWRTNVTILSGDLNGDDTGTDLSRADNVAHVVVGVNIPYDPNDDTDNTVLDGFTIMRGGNVNVTQSSILHEGLTLVRWDGGGIYNQKSSPVLSNLIIEGGKVNRDGAGIHNNESSPVITNVIIRDNEAKANGGGMWGFYGSSPVLTNVLISNNTAVDGGGIYNLNDGMDSNPLLTNVTIAGNTAVNGGGIFIHSGTPELRNTIVWGNSSGITGTPVINNTIIQGGTANGTNLGDVDPMYADAANGGYSLLGGSPAINRGDNSYLPAGLLTDLDGNSRILNGYVDIGAYESPEKGTAVIDFDDLPNEIIYGNTLTLTATFSGSGTETIIFTSGDTDYITIENGNVARAVQANGIAIPITASLSSNSNWSVQPVTHTINTVRRPITIQDMVINDKVYDGNTDATVDNWGTLVNVINNDDVDVVQTTYTADFDNKNVGTNKPVTISGLTLTGTDSHNYILVTPQGLEADITPLNLTVTGLTIKDKVYDGTTTAYIDNTGTLQTPIAGDDVRIDLNNYTADFDDKNVGEDKPVTVTMLGLTGTDAGNYTITLPTGFTADITPRPLTIEGLLINDKVYDGNNIATVGSWGTLRTVVTGDNVDFERSGYTAFFNDEKVGTNKPVALSVLVLTGSDKDNYTLVQPSGLTAAITPKGLSITGMTIYDRVYDGTTDAVINSWGALDPPLAGDNVQIDQSSYKADFDTKHVGTGKPVSLSAIALTGSDAGNYVVVSPSYLKANITPAPITVTADPDQNKIYGNSDPVFAYRITSGQLFVNDSFVGQLGRTPGEDVGIYYITVGTLNISDGNNGNNYTMTFEGADFNISSEKLVITADDQTKEYMAPDPPLTWTITSGNLKPGDVLIGSLKHDGVEVGEYPIVEDIPFSLNGNYDVTFIPGTMTILINKEAELDIVVDGNEWEFTSRYIVDCDKVGDVVEIEAIASPGATVTADKGTWTNGKLYVDVSRAGLHYITFTVVSQDGSNTKTYVLTIEKYFRFLDIAVQKWNNTLVLNLKTLNEDNYQIVGYRWFKDDVEIGTGSYYSAGPSSTDLLDNTAAYRVELTTQSGEILYSCEYIPVYQTRRTQVYPNPVERKGIVTIETDTQETANKIVKIYDNAGRFMKQHPVNGTLTSIEMPDISGVYILRLTGDNGDSEEVKVIVK